MCVSFSYIVHSYLTNKMFASIEYIFGLGGSIDSNDLLINNEFFLSTYWITYHPWFVPFTKKSCNMEILPNHETHTHPQL